MSAIQTWGPETFGIYFANRHFGLSHQYKLRVHQVKVRNLTGEANSFMKIRCSGGIAIRVVIRDDCVSLCTPDKMYSEEIQN